MRLMNFLAISLLMSTSMAMVAHAEDDDDRPRELVECVSGKKFAKLVRKISELEPEKRDTIDPSPNFTIKPADGGVMPKRFFAKSGGEEINLEISEDGQVLEFLKKFPQDKKSEFCAEDPSREGGPKNVKALDFSMEFDVAFRNESGAYSISELEDGLKDGKSVIKKIVPGPVALLIPKMTNILIEFNEADALFRFQAYQGGALIGDVPYERAGLDYLLSYEELEAMGADELRVSGGAHKISPTMSLEKLEKYDMIREE